MNRWSVSATSQKSGIRPLACFLTVVLLCGCSQEEQLQKLASPDVQARAKGFIDQLRAHDYDNIEKSADPSIKGPALRGTLEQMAGLIPAGEPASVKLIGVQAFQKRGYSMISTTFEYEFGDQWILIDVAVNNRGNDKTIIGFHVNPQSQSLESQFRFGLGGKRPVQYAVLGAAIAAALISIYALVVCLRTKLPGKKWPWVLFIVIGVGQITVNWATGQLNVVLLAVQLFSAAAFAQLYGPWTVSVSLPLGAAAFLVYRRMRLVRAAGH